MKRFNSSERLMIEEFTIYAQAAKTAVKGLSIGHLIQMIRVQLGMSQEVLAKRAEVPQVTISRIENSGTGANLSTLTKILEALSCDLVVVPILRESVDVIRHKQAQKQAEKHIRYLKGTMSLEQQQPDSRLLEQLMRQEEERFLQGPGSELWEK